MSDRPIGPSIVGYIGAAILLVLPVLVIYAVVAILLPSSLDEIWVYGCPLVALVVWLLYRRRASRAP